jgi:hypothetical protein
MNLHTSIRISAFALFVSAPLAFGQSPPCVEWNLAHDFAVSPNQANPNPDGCGNAGVWSFLDSDPAWFPVHDALTYRLLPEFTASAFGQPGLEQWHGTVDLGGVDNKLPAVGINNTGSPQSILGIDWPAGAVRVHPALHRFAIVGWKSPVTGNVRVTGGVADLQPGGNDGIVWSVDYYDGSTTSILASGSIPDGGGQLFQDGFGAANLVSVAVNVGDQLYFVVDKWTDLGGDSTGLNVVIAPVGSCGGIIANYCISAINSTGKAAHIGWLGSTSISQNDLVLTASDCPPNKNGIFFMGLYQTQIPFGEGYLCTTGNQHRFPKVAHIDGSGFANYSVDFTDPKSPASLIAAGVPWNFQFWYRDPQPVGHGFNLTDALAAQFCP